MTEKKKLKEPTMEEKITALLVKLNSCAIAIDKRVFGIPLEYDMAKQQMIKYVLSFLNELPVCGVEQKKFLVRMQEIGEYTTYPDGDSSLDIKYNSFIMQSDLSDIDLRKVLDGE